MSDPTIAVDGRPGRTETESMSELLSDPHCRYVLEALRQTEHPSSVAAITRHVVSGITDTAPQDVPEDVLRRVQIWLHQGQLPTLDEYGIVDFDAEAGTVRLVNDPLE